MAKESTDIEIRVTTKGTDKAKKAVKGIGASADKAKKSVLSFKKVLGGISAAIAVRTLVQYADAWTEINNRLKVVTTSSVEQQLVMGKLFKLAQETRSELKATAIVYSRIALATDGLGFSQTQLLRVTETLNKQVLIGGNNAEEARAGLIQFSQGLASGKLQGDELRSVLENLIGVQKALIGGFGKLHKAGKIDFKVTKANLRELAAQGTLTSAMLIEALLAWTKETDKAFDEVSVTISGGLIKVKNAFMKYIGEVDNASGASKTFVLVLNSIANNFKLFVDIVLAGVAAMVTWKVTMFALAAQARAVIKNNTLWSASIHKLINSWSVAKIKWLTFFKVSAALSVAIWGVTKIVELFSDSTSKSSITIAKQTKFMNLYRESIVGVTQVLKEQKQVQVIKQKLDIDIDIANIEKDIQQALAEHREATERSIALQRSIISPLKPDVTEGVFYQARIIDIKKLSEALQGALIAKDNFLKAEKERKLKPFQGLKDSVESYRTAMEKATIKITDSQKAQTALEGILKKLKNAFDSKVISLKQYKEVMLNTIDVNKEWTDSIALEQQEKMNKVLKEYGDIVSKTTRKDTIHNEALESHKKVMQDLKELRKDNILSQEQYNNVLTKTNSIYAEHLAALEAAQLDKKMEQIAQKMEDSITDAVLNMSKGLGSFKDFVSAIFQDIAAEMVRSQISKPIAKFASGLLGDIFGSMLGTPTGGNFGNAPSSTTPGGFTKIPGRAKGGTVSGNSPYVVGEQGAELFIPSKTGTIVPNGASMGNTTNVTVNYSPQVTAFSPQQASVAIAENAPTVVSIIRQAFNRTGQSVSI